MILGLLRPFLPYLITIAVFAAVVGGAYQKGKSVVKEQWATAVAHANAAAEQKRLTTDFNVRNADAIRAEKAEAELKTFKEKSEAHAKALKHPARECFDADDTLRVQRLFER